MWKKSFVRIFMIFFCVKKNLDFQQCSTKISFFFLCETEWKCWQEKGKITTKENKRKLIFSIKSLMFFPSIRNITEPLLSLKAMILIKWPQKHCRWPPWWHRDIERDTEEHVSQHVSTHFVFKMRVTVSFPPLMLRDDAALNQVKTLSRTNWAQINGLQTLMGLLSVS